MKIETKEVYKCDYCNRMYQRKFLCEKHEVACKKRPDYTRPCHSCKNVEKRRETILVGYDMYGDEHERVVEVLFCSKLDCFIHPPSVAAKGNAFDMGDKDNLEMPHSCDSYTEQDYL